MKSQKNQEMFNKMDKHKRDLNTIFKNSVLIDLARNCQSKIITYLIEQLGVEPKTYAEFYQACYSHLCKYYRSEYVYKNAIVNKILLGRYSLKTTRYFPEFRVGQSKADVVLINGTSSAYEIKTELDNFDRLSSQLNDYMGVFDKIYVVTHPSCSLKLEKEIENNIGILVLTEEYTLKTLREAISNKESVNPKIIFDSLRRSEYCDIIQSATGTVPNVPNTKNYSVCREIFCSLNPTFVHDEMVKVLHKRFLHKYIYYLVSNVPHCLRAAILSLSISNNEANQLTNTLNMKHS